ncbi:unnamed protein product, partial [Amoebophrya sp. A25]
RKHQEISSISAALVKTSLYAFYNFSDIYWGFIDFGESSRFNVGVHSFLRKFSRNDAHAQDTSSAASEVNKESRTTTVSSGSAQSSCAKDGSSANEMRLSHVFSKGKATRTRLDEGGRRCQTTDTKKDPYASVRPWFLHLPAWGDADAPGYLEMSGVEGGDESNNEGTRKYSGKPLDIRYPIFREFVLEQARNTRLSWSSQTETASELVAVTMGSHFGSNMEPTFMLQHLLAQSRSEATTSISLRQHVYGTIYPYPEVVCTAHGFCRRNLL